MHANQGMSWTEIIQLKCKLVQLSLKTKNEPVTYPFHKKI